MVKLRAKLMGKYFRSAVETENTSVYEEIFSFSMCAALPVDVGKGAEGTAVAELDGSGRVLRPVL